MLPDRVFLLCLIHFVICTYGETSEAHCDGNAQNTVQIPRIEMDSPDRTALAAKFDAAMHEIGVVELVNHGVPSWAIQGARDGGNAFFNLNLAEKLTYRLRDTAKCGYSPMGALKVSDDDYESEEYRDDNDGDIAEMFFLQLREMQFAGTTMEVPIDGNDSLLNTDLMISSWPYIRWVGELRREVHTLAAIALGLENDQYFEDELMVDPDQHYPLMVHLHYAPRNESTAALRLKAHTDAMTFTFVVNDAVPGLELFVKDEWRAIEPTEEGSILLFGGDGLNVYTNDWWQAMSHRVVWSEDEKMANSYRHTMTYFAGPDYDQLIYPIAGCAKCNASNTRYEPRTVAEHFRLRFDSGVATE